MENHISQLKSAILPQFEDVINPVNERGENSFYYKRYCYEWEKEWKTDIQNHSHYDKVDKDLIIEFLKHQTLLILNTVRLFKLVNNHKEPNPSLPVKISLVQSDVEQRLNSIGYFENQLKHRVRQKEHSLALDIQYDLLLIFQESLSILKSNCQIDVLRSPLAAKFEEARKKLKKSVDKKEIDIFLRVQNKTETARGKSINLSTSKHNEDFLWFKVGLKFATGEIGQDALKYKSAPEIAKEIDIPGSEKYILGTLNDYQKEGNKDKNIYAYRMRMQFIIDHCKTNNTPMNQVFLDNFNSLPLE